MKKAAARRRFRKPVTIGEILQVVEVASPKR
jgi:hypothetical protein